MNIRPLFAFILCFTSSFSFGQSLLFKGCAPEDGACNAKMYAQIVDLFQQAASQEIGYALDDSISISFAITNDTKVAVTDTYAQFSQVLRQLLSDIVVDNLPERLHQAQAPGTYTMNFSFRLDEHFEKEYTSLENATSFPVVKNCSDFNTKGQRACLRYLADILLYEIKQQTAVESPGKFVLYMRGTKLEGISYKLPFTDRHTHDYIVQNMDTIMQKYIMPDMAGEGKRIKMEINFEPFLGKRKAKNLADSTWAYDADMKHLERLKGIKNNEYYLMRTFYLSAAYFTDAAEQKKDFIRAKLAAVGLQNADEVYLKHACQRINMDSLYNYTPSKDKVILNFGEVESVPVFKGCDKDAGNTALKECFQSKITRFVGREFKFPKAAIKQGISGKIYISFVVEKDGQLGEISILRLSDPLLDFEGIRVVSEIPDFTAPAIKGGKPVCMSFALPINAKLQ